MALHEVPYHRDGNMLDGIYRWHKKEDFDFFPNAPFEAELALAEYHTGGNHPKYYMVNPETGVVYPMFFSEFMRLFIAEAFIGQKTKPLMWHAVKRGSAYGIVAINA